MRAQRFTICRVIGNELPPRDSPGGKLASLRHILDVERDIDRVWVVNHLHDPSYRRVVVDLLESHSERFHEIVFDPHRYFGLSTRDERVCYAINVNEARNVAIALTRPQSDFAVCLDQDCFFTPALWHAATELVRADQVTRPDRQYYGVFSKRLMANHEIDPELLPDNEPQLICRSDAGVLFNPSLPFGRGDKMTLLQSLGYGPSPDYVLRGDRCRTAGCVLHVRCGDRSSEVSLRLRMRARAQAIQALLDRVEAQYTDPLARAIS